MFDLGKINLDILCSLVQVRIICENYVYHRTKKQKKGFTGAPIKNKQIYRRKFIIQDNKYQKISFYKQRDKTFAAKMSKK